MEYRIQEMNTKQISKGLRAAAAKFKSSLREDKVAARYQVAAKKVQFQHCETDRFFKSTRPSSSLGYVAVNDAVPGGARGLHALVCANCGCVALFGVAPADLA